MSTTLRTVKTLLCGLLVVAATASAQTTRLPATQNYLTGYPAIPSAGLANAVIEIPAGTNAKWEATKDGTALEWEVKGGQLRVIRYLAYPANYGMIPRTRLPKSLGGDGDPLDVVVLGSALERGSVVQVRPIGVLRLLDDGERDDKILAVQTTGPLSDVSDLSQLEARYRGVAQIVETWFSNYKGPGRLESRGLEGSANALSVIGEASRYFENRPAQPGKPSEPPLGVPGTRP